MNSPFNQDRYERLLEGLEAVETRLSQINNEFRIDAQFFWKEFLEEDIHRKRYPNNLLGSQAYITDGPHGYHEVDNSSPIRMLTAKNARGWFARPEGADFISETTHNTNLRSSLNRGDLILSTRGTVGLCAIVQEDVLPANIDQDVARIALNEETEILPEYMLSYLNCQFGQDWMTRNMTGMVQQGLSLAKVREIPIPRLSGRFQLQIKQAIETAWSQQISSKQLQSEAEQTLLEELGLEDWHPPEPLTYQRRAKDVFEAGRLDSEYFTPRVQQLISKLSESGIAVGQVAPIRKKYFHPVAGKPFNYIEISDITQYGEVNSSRIDGSKAPSRATWRVETGDVITSTVRPIRRLTALIYPDQNNFVCSSGFVVLQPKSIPPELLLVYLRLPIICELMDLQTTASMYPAISVSDILALPFLKPSERTISTIVDQVQSAHSAHHRANALLEQAKRAVEIAIEDSEEAGLVYLNSEEH